MVDYNLQDNFHIEGSYQVDTAVEVDIEDIDFEVETAEVKTAEVDIVVGVDIVLEVDIVGASIEMNIAVMKNLKVEEGCFQLYELFLELKFHQQQLFERNFSWMILNNFMFEQ